MCRRRELTTLSAGGGGYVAFIKRKRNVESYVRYFKKNQEMDMIKRCMHVYGPLC